ncbi:GNAT family N-acetyltransferase [Tenggerimyces flavus]|uniref:GNAT family N-acetyltransferase n=1 Tax=Tenggerimyces flavus TaxID=1708749 RepID=A0ABV7YDP4_9ACTN|nr:GNAT family N-acetyltransferase [Tenggerimyces flavus]MBM7786962.1 GNAT superfamily N-acetyltransferase [Tenggerimyces flavus]
MHEYTIRQPRLEDADQLGEIHVRIWREAYAGLIVQRYLDELEPARSADRWRAMLAEKDDAIGRLVGLAGDEVVGFITVGPARDDDPPTPLELMAINVLASHHGTGLARRLVTEALGDREAYLWVVDGNERAMSFYRKFGFELDGGTKVDERLEATEHRMTRPRET